MRNEELEDLFERYRSDGEADALEQVFDRAAPEVLRIAHHLVGDAELAEELVQATFVAAIENAASYDRGRRLVPWLLGILANRVRRAHAASALAPDPRRLRRPEPADPAQESERRELRPVVDRALASMPKTYREVLVAHLVDGRRAADIARDLGRAPGTVRMQILRGLELLRRALPAGLATGVAATVGAPRGLAAVKVAVLKHAAGPSAAAGLAPLTAPLALGGIVMSVKAVAVFVGALAVLTGSWFALRDAPRSAEVALPDRDPTPLAESSLRALDGGKDSDAAPRETLALGEARDARADVEPADADATGAPGWYLVGSVSGLSPGSDPSEVVLNVFCHDVDGPADPAAAGAHEDGSFDVDLGDLLSLPGRPSRDLFVSANHPLHLVANAIVHVEADALERGREQRVELPIDLTLQPAAGVDGRVRPPAGWALDAFEVGLFAVGEDGEPALEPLRSTPLEPDGRFEFRKRRPGRHVVVATAEGLAPAVLALELRAGEIVDAGTLEPAAGGATLAGTVVLPPGAPRAGCRVRARSLELTADEHDELWRGLQWSDGAARVREQLATTDETGAFELTGLTPGEYEVRLVGVDHTLIAEPTVLATAPAEGLLLGEDLGRITVVASSAGEPVRHAHTSFSDLEQSFSTLTGDDGHAVVYAPLDRGLVVEVRRRDLTPESRELPAEDRVLDQRLDFELAPAGDQRATLVLTPRFATEHGLERIQVHLQPLGSGASRGEDVVFDGSWFKIRDVVPGRYRVDVEPFEERVGPTYRTYWYLESFEIELLPGREHRHPLLGQLGGRLSLSVEGVDSSDLPTSFRLQDADGTEWPVRLVSTSFRDNVIRVSATTGELLLGEEMVAYPNLPPGRYALSAEVEGYAPIARSLDVVPGRTTDVTLHFRRP